MEQRSSGSHFGEDAANTPDVNGTRVSRCAEENLRRSVPQCDDLVGVHADRNTEGARQTEIGQLYHAVKVDQQVLWLQIAMHGAALVTVKNAFDCPQRNFSSN
jgi:hypothetical protein